MGQAPVLMKAEEVAELFRVHVQTVYRWGQWIDGNPPVLPAITIGKTVRFRRADVEAKLATGIPVEPDVEAVS